MNRGQTANILSVPLFFPHFPLRLTSKPSVKLCAALSYLHVQRKQVTKPGMLGLVTKVR